jgi:hypothetical protein
MLSMASHPFAQSLGRGLDPDDLSNVKEGEEDDAVLQFPSLPSQLPLGPPGSLVFVLVDGARRPRPHHPSAHSSFLMKNHKCHAPQKTPCQCMDELLGTWY